MIKLKVLSGVLSVAVLCSASIVSAESAVVGQLVANPSAIINAGSAQQKVGSQATAYIQGDTITTGSGSSASVSLSSGVAKLVIAPNTVMAVTNASSTQFSLSRGAFSVQAKEGQMVTVETSVGAFDLVSSASIDAIASFQNGEFSVIPKNGLLTVTSQDGSVTSIDTGSAFVYNVKGATSLDVQTAETGSGGGSLAAVAVAGGVVAGGVLISEGISDGDDSEVIEVDAASPAQ